MLLSRHFLCEDLSEVVRRDLHCLPQHEPLVEEAPQRVASWPPTTFCDPSPQLSKASC